MQAVIITGPPGAGKTAVLTALTNLLADEDVRHAAVEVEALAWTHPWPDDEAALAHLHTICGSYRKRGYPLVLIAATLESDDHRRRVIEAIGADQLLLVRLEAPVALLKARISSREPATWSGLPRLLAACDELAATIASLSGVDLAVSTEQAEPGAVAATIRRAMDPG